MFRLLGICYADWAGLELREIHLPLSPELLKACRTMPHFYLLHIHYKKLL